jgi:hypothetical protein
MRICKTCGSTEFMEKEVNNIHKIGVYCKNCDCYYEWGTLKEPVPNGKHHAKVVSSEEVRDRFILIGLKVNGYKKTNCKIWKNGSGHYPSYMLNRFVKGYKDIQDFMQLCIGKEVIIDVQDKKINPIP